MARRAWVLLTILVLAAGAVRTASAAKLTAAETRKALEAAAARMGVTNMKSIQYSGTGWQGAVGQNYTPDADWPRFDLTSYTRTIDFETQSSKEEYVRTQGRHVARGGGGTPLAGDQHITRLVSGNYAWDIVAQGKPVPRPALAEFRQLEIWLTPHGFLKGAMAGEATAVTRNEYDQRVTVVSFTALGKYLINGTINADNVIQRVQTWVPNPVVGDMYYETVFTEYRNINGVMFPGRWHQHQDYDDGGRLPNISGGDHSFGLETISDMKINPGSLSLNVPDAVRQAKVRPVRVDVQKLADGVWLMGGGSHNSLAVEFKDTVAVVEAPLNEERSLAVIAEIAKLVPNKPIRYVVSTHHHWDHIGGLRAYVHEGATVIMHEGNRAYFEQILTAGRWVLKPDLYSMHPPEEWAEGYVFETVREQYMLGDENHTIQLHTIHNGYGGPGTGRIGHAEGMLVAYLPKEKILVEADLYNPGRVTAKPTAANKTLADNIRDMKLDVDTIVPIHGKPVPMSDFMKFMSRAD